MRKYVKRRINFNEDRNFYGITARNAVLWEGDFKSMVSNLIKDFIISFEDTHPNEYLGDYSIESVVDMFEDWLIDWLDIYFDKLDAEVLVVYDRGRYNVFGDTDKFVYWLNSKTNFKMLLAKKINEI